MKYTFDPNKVNVFTFMNKNKEPNKIIQHCMETWKCIKNSEIYIFDMQDVIDTFPGLVDNDYYYLTMNNNSEYTGNIINHYLVSYNKNTNSVEFDPSHKMRVRECCYSTDSLRLRLALLIPNALYMDSDIQIIDIDAFNNILYERFDTSFNYNSQNSCCVFYNGEGKNSYFINEYLNFYNNILKDKISIDFFTYTAFIEYAKYNLNYEKISKFSIDISHYNIYVHQFYIKGLNSNPAIRSIGNRNIVVYVLLDTTLGSNKKAIYDKLCYMKTMAENYNITHPSDTSILMVDSMVKFNSDIYNNVLNHNLAYSTIIVYDGLNSNYFYNNKNIDNLIKEKTFRDLFDIDSNQIIDIKYEVIE